MQVYEQSMNRMAHVAFFENGEIIYAPTAAVLRRALRTRSRLDPCRVWFRPTDEWKAASDAYLAAWRAALHNVYAGGFTHCAQQSGQTMEDVTSLDSSSIHVYVITDDSAGDCADASEVYGA